MISLYFSDGRRLVETDTTPEEILAAVDGPTPVWVDVSAPTPDEIAAVEKAFSIKLPTSEEMKGLEVSGRLYHEGVAHVMTTSLVYRIESPEPASGEITFIVLPRTAITFRYSAPRAIPLFTRRAMTGDIGCDRPEAIVIGLLETMIERQADLIERLQSQTETISKQIFTIKGHDYSRAKRHAVSLKEIGKVSVMASRTRESLVSQSRLLTYFRNFTQETGCDAVIRQRIKASQLDVHSLAAHVDHISSRLTFLMDATIGLVGIEQNQIIKLFSVVAVMLMPPTLIASVYGMNFQHMPELQFVWAYPVTLAAMAVSAIVPFVYFKGKGWL